MRKSIFVLVAVICALAVGCMSLQLEKDIRDYSDAERFGRPPQDVLLANDEMAAIAGNGTLGEYVVFALERNPAVRAAHGMWLAAKTRVITESSLDDPMVTYGHFLEEVETRVGPQRDRLSVMQKIPAPPKLSLRGRAAAEAAAVAEQEYKATALDVAMKVKTAYYELWYVEKAAAITRENRDLLRNFVKIAQAQLRVAKATQQDVLKAQVELDKMENDLIVLEEQWEALLAGFNALLYRPLSSEVKLPDDLDVSTDVTRLNDLYDKAVKKRPEILKANAAVNRGKTMLTLAKLKKIPDLTLGVDWIMVSSATAGNPPDSGKDAVQMSFGFNFPIWLNKLKAQELEARAAGVPITNYGLAIAHLHNILPRALRPFPEALAILSERQTVRKKRASNGDKM